MTVTVSHRDTCLACFVTDHHNRPGECLVGVAVYRSSRNHEVRTALYDEAASLLGHRDDAPDMAALSAAINDAFSTAHPLKCFDRTIEHGDTCRGEDLCQAWFLITWPAAEDAGDDEAEGDDVPAPAPMVAQPVQQQQARDVRRGMARCDEPGCWQIGIYCVARDDAGKWAAAATGPGTIGDGYAGTYDTLAAAYLALTGEPMPGAATAAMAQPVQQQQAQARPSHSADAWRPQAIAFGPARLYPSAEGAIMTGTPDAPEGATLLGYNTPGGRFYAAAYRLTNGCVLVDVCSARGPYDARLRRVFVNLGCAELYAGRLARLVRYRARRDGDLIALGHMRAAARGAAAGSWAHQRRKTAQRQLAAWRASHADTRDAFGAELPPVIDAATDAQWHAGVDLTADWLA